MTHRRFFSRVFTLLGLVLSVLILTMAMLKLVQAQGAPSITITKEPDQTVVSGSTVTFTITITNTGNVTLTNITVSDAQAANCNRGIGHLPDLTPHGGTTSYVCTRTHVTVGFTNSATVTGRDTLSATEVSDTDTAFVDVINPAIEMAKTPEAQTVVSGTSATFTIAVTNTGDVTLTNVTVSDALAPGCNNDGLPDLAPGASTSYGCTVANVTDGFINSATASGQPPAGEDVTDTDTAFVDVIVPAIEIAKTPEAQTVVSGTSATFTIAVTNTGDVTLTNVTVSDALAPDCDDDDLPDLAPGVSTSYECTLANVTADLTNSATVTGTDTVLNTDVTNTDTASVDVIAPAIEIAKTPYTQTVVSGATVTFTIVVTNTGDVTLTNVAVSDTQAPNCVQTFAELLVNEHQSHSCAVANVTDGFINSATASGQPPAGEDVTDADAAKVKLDETQACPSDMLAYWKLDETGSGDYDDFYYGHDGECAGDCPTPVTNGHVNGGQEFNGSSTGIDVPVVPGDDSFNWGAHDSFSIEFWMKANSANSCSNSNEVIVGRDDSSSQLHWWVGIGCGSWANGGAAFVLGDNDGGGDILGVVGTTDLTDGSWHHIVAVRDGSTNENRIYVDGTAEASESATYSAGFDSLTAALNIGWIHLSHGFHFDGIADEVAVYDRALSTDGIRQHYNEGLAGRWYCQGGTYAPIIVSTPVTEATVGRPYIYDVEAAGNPLPTYALITHPNGMTIDPASGLISWTPTVAQEGNHDVEVEANNSEGSATQNFTVVAHEGTLCPTDMLAYWKLDETSGTTYYDFYDGHDGECAGDCPDPATGHINGGQVFSSTTGIDVPADEDFDWGAGDSFSIEFWMRRPGTPTGNEVIVGRDDSATNLHWWVGVGQWVGNVAAFCLYETDGTGTCLTGEKVVTGGDWHHIAAVRDAAANELRIYVDGEEDGLVEPPSYSAGFDSMTAALNIGWLNLNPYFHFEGIADEVALYDRALSATEIQQHYDNDGGDGPGYCIYPDITVSKMANPSVVYLGNMVTYTYTVTSPGDAPLSDVNVSDDQCSLVTFEAGDDDSDERLDPSETWLYQCSMILSADITNTVTVTGTHCLSDTVGDTDTIFVDVIDPEITVDKTAEPMTIYARDIVTYTYTVTNPGDDPLSGVNVSDDKCRGVMIFGGGDNNDNYKMDAGEIWTYTCSTAVSTDITNTATVTGTDSAGGTVSKTDTAFVDVINPEIAIDKTAEPTTIYAGDTVTYTYAVTNPGDDPLSDVSVSDDECSSVTLEAGDDNSDDRLDPTETWLYQCLTILSADITNTVTATATDSAGGPVSDTDTAFVDVRDSTIVILKQANDDSTVFEFTFGYSGNNEPFQLKNGEGKQFSNLAPGSYTVTETVVSEWELLSITCTNGISIAPDTPAITINLQSEQDVSCTFTNYNKGPADPYPHKIYLPIILKD